jgi:hypothetical protein
LTSLAPRTTITITTIVIIIIIIINQQHGRDGRLWVRTCP